MKKVLLCLGLLCWAALLPALPACTSDDTASSSSSGSSGSSGAGTAAATVNLVPNRFDPPSVTIKVGQTVQWKWGGGTHNVVGGTNCTPDTGPNKFTSGDPTSGGTFDKKF